MDTLVDHILELLGPLGPVSAKRMFGGYGLFHDELMFALITGETLYLKADEANKRRFEEMGLERFSYVRSGKNVYLSYYHAPIDILEDGELLIEWAKGSIDTALRHAGTKNRAT